MGDDSGHGDAAHEPRLPEPSAAADGPSRDPEDGLRAALAASTRAEASLSALMRAVQQVTSGVSGAQEANERLASELEKVRELLATVNQQRLALRNRVETLDEALRRNEDALIQMRHEAENERAFLVDEQDRFLRSLLEDHEAQIAELRREIDQARKNATSSSEKKTLPGIPLPAGHRETAPQDQGLATLRADLDKLLTERDRSRELLRRIQAQRDEAQRQVTELGRERDEARNEVARLTALLDAPPELGAELRAQDARLLKPTPTRLHGRRTDPQPWSGSSEHSTESSLRATKPPPPDALEAALLASRMTSPPELPLIQPDRPALGRPALGAVDDGPVSRPPPPALLRRQDPLLRPRGGYSVRPEEPDQDSVGELPGPAKRSR